MNAYRRILAAVDGSEAAEAGLREALRLAKNEAAEPLPRASGSSLACRLREVSSSPLHSAD